MRGLFIILFIGVLWWIVGNQGIIPPLYLPKLEDVLLSYNHSILLDCGATIYRTLLGFMVGILLAYSIHFLSVVRNWVDRLDPHFAASRAVPGIALMPLFILWFGFGETGRVLIVSLTASLYFLAPLQGAYQNIPREWSLLKNQIELNKYKYYLNIILPGTIGHLLGAFRLTMAVSFTIAIASDYMGAQIGLGKFIDSARVTFNISGIFLALIVAALIGLTLDRIVLIIFKRFVHWTGKTLKA
jgi:ABC-type nitrate/sulfonate/bicarbonate transport system permease component